MMSTDRATRRFLRSRAGTGFLKFLGFSALLGASVAYGLYAFAVGWFQETKSEEQLTALQLVDAFVGDYAETRAKFLSGDAPVPATYRAHAIERFNRGRADAANLHLVMVGPPGREISIPPADEDMALTIGRFIEAPHPKPETRFVRLGDATLFRAAVPSIASQQACVDCHNKLQAGKTVWKLNDVLGAFVVDVPAGPFLHRSLFEASGLGLAIFLLLGGVGLYISLLHFRQTNEREAAQARIALSEERFRDFALTASDWFWEQDEDQRFTFFSSGRADDSGNSTRPLIGKTPRELSQNGTSEEAWQAHAEDIAARRPFRNFQLQRRTSSGKVSHLSISGRPVLAADGTFRGYRGSSRDVTREVMAEAELERRVAERTEQLQEVQGELLRKERLATLGQLTATVSHELRNPLGVIRNTIFTIAEVASAGGLKIERPIGRIERSISRCDSIIGELLDYTRVKELRRETVIIDSWLGEVLDEQKLGDKILMLRDFCAPEQSVSLDVDRFRRVLINLIDNAAQAIEGDRERPPEREAPTITVRTCIVGDTVEISVADTGPGMAPDVFKRIFEPLFSTKGFGVGLGLPTVKQIVENHGGVIEITSELGIGTVACVRLPLPLAKGIAA